MRPIKVRYYLIGFVIFLILKSVLTSNPLWVERFYTQGFYAFYLTIVTAITQIFPFSVGDVLYFLVGLLLLWKLFLLRKTNRGFKQRLIATMRLLVKGCLLFYVGFNVCWGLNNYRLPLASQLDLKMGYTSNELVDITQEIIAQTNHLQLALTADSTQAVVLSYSHQQIRKEAQLGMATLGKETQWFAYTPLQAKGSLYSLPLTYMGFSGYVNPFTLEAQVNTKIPTSTLIVTSSHEMAHQMGYAKESEANFIGFLAAKKQTDPKYRYSANIFALRYCLKAVESELTAEQFKILIEPIQEKK